MVIESWHESANHIVLSIGDMIVDVATGQIGVLVFREHRVTYGQLVKVYRRGQGAFLGGGSRRVPMAAWAMGRVNSFLRGSRKHDTDLRRKRRKK